ncbi:hypothetical protein MMC07_006066 [Pseudocyphellaria aurata]|nr:hypothetical protein [Pseudocyphellaria aurata]
MTFAGVASQKVASGKRKNMCGPRPLWGLANGVLDEIAAAWANGVYNPNRQNHQKAKAFIKRLNAYYPMMAALDHGLPMADVDALGLESDDDDDDADDESGGEGPSRLRAYPHQGSKKAPDRTSRPLGQRKAAQLSDDAANNEFRTAHPRARKLRQKPTRNSASRDTKETASGQFPSDRTNPSPIRRKYASLLSPTSQSILADYKVRKSSATSLISNASDVSEFLEQKINTFELEMDIADFYKKSLKQAYKQDNIEVGGLTEALDKVNRENTGKKREWIALKRQKVLLLGSSRQAPLAKLLLLPGFSHQAPLTRLLSPGSSRQALLARVLMPGSSRQAPLAKLLFLPGSSHQALFAKLLLPSFSRQAPLLTRLLLPFSPDVLIEEDIAANKNVDFETHDTSGNACPP